MTDRDTIVRVGELFRRAVVATRPRQTHHKVAYVTTIKGVPAARMMRALAPLMSPRRRTQIERALRDRGPRIGGRIRRSSRAAEELVTDGAELSWEAANADARIAWLAGVLEGEGSFLSARFDGHCYPRVQMTMCDRFVLERAMTLMPGSHIYAVSDKRGDERGWSDSWIVMVNGLPSSRGHEGCAAVDGIAKNQGDRSFTFSLAPDPCCGSSLVVHRARMPAAARCPRTLQHPLHELGRAIAPRGGLRGSRRSAD